MDHGIEGFDLITEKPRRRGYNCFISSKWTNFLIIFLAVALSVVVITNISLTVRLMREPCVKQADFKQEAGQLVLNALKYTFSESETSIDGSASTPTKGVPSNRHTDSVSIKENSNDGMGSILAQVTQDDLDEIRGSCKGPKGDKGSNVKGDMGLQGLTGETGLKGDIGVRGQTGEAGDRGVQGSLGVHGVPGIKGAKGDPGLNGQVGAKGVKGDKGDIGIKGEPGEKGSAPPGLRYSCGFENGTTCNFNQSETDDINWVITNQRTPSDDTGPSTAYEGSYYIHIEATSTAVGAEATLILPFIPVTAGQMCLQFYYHMYGDHIGELSGKLVYDDNSEEQLFQNAGNQGNLWFIRKYDIPVKTKSYQVWLTAVRGADYQSDIALDDISIRSGFC